MRSYLYLTAAIGVTGVIAGAFGAHALKDTLTAQGTLSTWNTAVLYHLIHAPALLAAGFFSIDNNRATSWWAKAFACWTIGIVLFSGSLYWLSLGGPRLLGPVTPLGGLFLILGWLCVAGAAAKLNPNPTT
jgi:uncharacterized membrane protein YgdD (TMEM256/DUF423 family)